MPGLVQRVQRRLAATGAVASDVAGLRAAVAEALDEDGVQPPAHLAALVRSIGDELTGLGPLAPLLADPTVTDVMVNGPAEVWVERGGAIERAAVRFASAAAVAALVQRVVAPLGLRVDESRPWVDARLPGGERFHAVLPPLAPDGPVVTIRTFARRRLQLRDLIERNALDAATARLLEAMVAAGIAIAVSGATGTGKTTLLNVLAAAIPAQERVVTIEDLAELRLPGPHVVRLEARPPNVEGRGEVPLRELVRNALRMRPRPDRRRRGPRPGGAGHAAGRQHRSPRSHDHPPRRQPRGGARPAGGHGPGRAGRRPRGRPPARRRRDRRGRPPRRVPAGLHPWPAGRRRPPSAGSPSSPSWSTTNDGRAHAIPLRTAGFTGGLSATGHVPRWADRLDPSVLPVFEPAHLGGRVRVLCPRSRGR